MAVVAVTFLVCSKASTGTGYRAVQLQIKGKTGVAVMAAMAAMAVTFIKIF